MGKKKPKLNFIERWAMKRAVKKIFEVDPDPQLPDDPIDLRQPEQLVAMAQHIEFLSKHGLDYFFQLMEWRAATEMAALDINKVQEKHLYYQMGRVSAFYALRQVAKNAIKHAGREAAKINK